nr:YfjI family protein [Sinirhodobacter sp. WL0062]
MGGLREVVEAVQGATLAPVAIPAASALTIASLAVQGLVDVETLGGVRPVSLFAMTIAQSGERKSSCDARLMEGLRAFAIGEDKIYRDSMASWANVQEVHAARRSKIISDYRREKTGANKAALEADLNALGKEPIAPPDPNRLVGGQSIQGITRQFREGMPTLGLFSDEGGRFLGGYAMSSENRLATMAALNDLWQGSEVRISLAGTGSYVLYGRRLAAHLMVQPGVAREFMNDPMGADTGLLARFLICEPKSTIGTRLQARVRRDEGALMRFSERLAEILASPLPMDPETRALNPRVLRLSTDAYEMLAHFADHVEAEQAPGGVYVGVKGAASKAAEQAARISGVLTVWTDICAAEVDAATMADAIRIAQFYLDEGRRLSEAAIASAEIERAEALRKWLVTNWPHPEITPSEVVQRAPISSLRTSPAARSAIAILVNHGWLVALPEGTVVREQSRKEAYQICRVWHEV